MTRGEWALIGAVMGLIVGVTLAVFVQRRQAEDKMIAPSIAIPESGRAVYGYYLKDRKYERRIMRRFSVAIGTDSIWLLEGEEGAQLDYGPPSLWGECEIGWEYKEAME